MYMSKIYSEAYKKANSNYVLINRNSSYIFSKQLSIAFMFLLATLVGCKKSMEIIPEIKPPVVVVPRDTINLVSATPTTITNGMKNYESWFLAKSDNKIHGYIISTPLDYNPLSPKINPLLVFIHGDWEKPKNANYDYDKLKLYGPHNEIFYKQRAFPAIVASIQMTESDIYANPAVVKEFIDIVVGRTAFIQTTDEAKGLGRYYIDSNKVHLTGMSWGGNGVYKTAIAYPNYFASLSVFGGFTEVEEKMSLIKEPLYVRHNLNDNMVTEYNAINAAKWINAAGPKAPVNIQLLNFQGHDCWSPEYARKDNESVYEWHWSKKK